MDTLTETWLRPIAARIFAMDPEIRSVVWALQRDGDEVLEDWIPCPGVKLRWPECVDDNRWLEDPALDDLLSEACLELPSPDLGSWLVGLPADGEFHPRRLVLRDGTVTEIVAPVSPEG
jgi:hypothetical protein